VLPKEQPLVYNVDNKIVALHESHHEDFAVQLKPIITLPKYSLYHIDVEFIGDVQRLDVDNMSKIYLPVLNKLGIKDDDIHRISMSKRIKKNHSGAISLQVNPH
jgi:Holliday junction resolvase RusA-like endonuclease